MPPLERRPAKSSRKSAGWETSSSIEAAYDSRLHADAAFPRSASRGFELWAALRFLCPLSQTHDRQSRALDAQGAVMLDRRA